LNLLKISELGLIEMTRKRTRENLVQQLCERCPNCEGTGHVQSALTVSQRVLRELPRSTSYLSAETLIVHAHPDVVTVLRGEEAESPENTSAGLQRRVEVRSNPSSHSEQFEITAST